MIIGNIYVIGDGSSYDGQKVILLWMSKSKIIAMGSKRYTQGHGRLLSNNKKINFVVELLKTEKIANYSEYNKIKLIKLIKKGDKKAKKEYIKRFKKIPKF